MPVQKHSMQPAATVVALFGGCRPMARLLDLNASTISRWTTAANQGGTGGRIPQKYWKLIADCAAQHGKKLTVNDLAGWA